MPRRPLTSSVPRLLREYVVDRAPGRTTTGTTQLVVLVLRTTDGREFRAAMSKVDAFVMSTKLRAAADEAQAQMLKEDA